MTLEPLGDHLWQSTVFAAAVGLLALSLRRNRASARYWLWLATSVKFLIPFAALMALGSHFQWRSAPLIAEPTMAAIHTLSHPFSQLDFAPASPGSGPITSALPVSTFMLIAWLAGCLVILSRWWLRWRQVAAVAREAQPITEGRELEILRRLEQRIGIKRSIPLVSSISRLEPGIFGIFGPVLLWPQQMSDRFDDAQVEAIMAHEIFHVRRRDNLFASVHVFVESVFWFHPLVWWLGTRLVDERERACDEEVVRLGSEPHVYAQSILKTCQFCVESPLVNVSRVTGADLKRRIEQIVTNVAGEELTVAKRLSLAGVAILAVAAPLIGGAMSAPRLQAQSTSANATTPAFEVASIKRNNSGSMQMSMAASPGGRVDTTNVTLKMLLRQAYRLQSFQIVGGPSWLDSNRFDIQAKAEGNLPAEQLQLALRALLVDRFNLVVHNEMRELPIYALVMAQSGGKAGPLLKQASQLCGQTAGPPTPDQWCGIRVMPGNYTGRATTLGQLAMSLSTSLGRVVLNLTGLTESYDFELKWTPDQMPQAQPGFPPPPGAPPPPPIDPNGPSLFTAVQEQLGLKLDSQTGPVEVLVIDRAEQPTPD